MPINKDFIGKSYPASPPYLVGREKIREFATAIGDNNPAFHSVEAAQALGYSDVIAPPTFAFAVAFSTMAAAIGDPDLGIDYRFVVHGEEHFEYARPIIAGDELVVINTIEEINYVRSNEMMTVRQDLQTVDGEHVVTARNTLVSRGTAPAEEA